ncbi:tocopherol cyclase family protein [Terrisporobacter vanillatitrophus]|uniref:tocopherol cyclase family protein n=1 Tax=Terrisporobacter vanillatitrophus TaxID=3058402 RepID=UPI003367E619
MKETFNPNLYHGKHKRKNFFEGWYFKIVDNKNDYKLAIIPGISYGNNKDEHHSFIQILNGKESTFNYLSYDVKDFRYNNNRFRIFINSNIFSLENINLSIDSNDLNIHGNLILKNLVKWPGSIINPGSMGFYNYLKFMECYSHVCVLNGSIIGDLNINGINVNFTAGKVYIEKNWGKSFPKSWLWIQSNSFKSRKASITCSIGTIPFPIRDFTGFIIGLTLENEFYSFTTINHSKINIQNFGNDIALTVTKKNFRLTLKTYTNPKDFLVLKAPNQGSMTSTVKETINGQVYILLEDTKINKKIFEGMGLSAGVEYGGNFSSFFK